MERALNFVKLRSYYKMFRSSVRNCDAVMIEWLYKEFLGIYDATGKHNYFEIDCGMIETLYKSILYKTLQLVRINRCLPLHGGLDRFNKPMPNWAQDDILEHIQLEYHTMPFAHSAHLMTKKKCLKFTQNEYSSGVNCSYTHSNNAHDPAKVRKATSVPKRTPEKNAISEFISKLGLCDNIIKVYFIVVWMIRSKITSGMPPRSTRGKICTFRQAGQSLQTGTIGCP